jgi:hypothetical protein
MSAGTTWCALFLVEVVVRPNVLTAHDRVSDRIEFLAPHEFSAIRFACRVIIAGMRVIDHTRSSR